MSILTIEFLGFGAMMLAVYYILPLKIRSWALLGFSAAFLKWFISTFLRQFDAQMEFGIRKSRKKKAAQRPAAETASAPTEDEAAAPSEESRAAAFYERESEQKEDNANDAMFDTEPVSVQDEMDLILASIGSLDDLLPEKEGDNA